MAYNKKADENYRKKYKYIGLKYAIKDKLEYARITQYCLDNELSIQSYIKSLIKQDLDSKGVPYPSPDNDWYGSIYDVWYMPRGQPGWLYMLPCAHLIGYNTVL